VVEAKVNPDDVTAALQALDYVIWVQANAKEIRDERPSRESNRRLRSGWSEPPVPYADGAISRLDAALRLREAGHLPATSEDGHQPAFFRQIQIAGTV
jgi:hypothetical protein